MTVYNRGRDGRPTTPAEPLMPNAVTTSGIPCRVEYDDVEPDGFGRRRFTMLWDDTASLRRAQCFHAVPANHFVTADVGGTA